MPKPSFSAYSDRCSASTSTLNSVAHQWGFTQQFAASDQVSDGDVEVRVAAAPVGDLSEGVSGEDVLQGISQVT